MIIIYIIRIYLFKSLYIYEGTYPFYKKRVTVFLLIALLNWNGISHIWTLVVQVPYWIVSNMVLSIGDEN